MRRAGTGCADKRRWVRACCPEGVSPTGDMDFPRIVFAPTWIYRPQWASTAGYQHGISVLARAPLPVASTMQQWRAYQHGIRIASAGIQQTAETPAGNRLTLR